MLIFINHVLMQYDMRANMNMQITQRNARQHVIRRDHMYSLTDFKDCKNVEILRK